MKYPTLQELGLTWIFHLEWISAAVLPGSIVVGFLLAAVSRQEDALGAPTAIGFVVSLLFLFAHHYFFFSRVLCPSCGGKLNRFKNAKNVPVKQAYTQLRNGYGCRHCGWKPKYARNS